MTVVNHVIGTCAAFVSALCFSAESLLLFYVRGVAHPFFILFCSSFIQTMLVAPLVLLTKQSLTNLKRNQVTQIILAGFLGAIDHAASTIAILLLGPGDATLIFYTEPIFAVCFSALFLAGTFKWTDILLAVTSLAAVVIISIPYIRNTPDEFNVIGGTCALFGAITSAANLVASRKLTESQISVFVISLSLSLQYFMSSVVLCTIFNAWSIPKDITRLLFTASSGFAVFLAVILQLYAIDKETPTSVSVILTSEVLITYLGEFLFFSYPLHWNTFVSCFLILMSTMGVIYTHDRTVNDTERENLLTEDVCQD